MMVDGSRPVVVPEEVFERAKEYYEENKEDLKLRDGIKCLTGFINYALREHLKHMGVI